MFLFLFSYTFILYIYLHVILHDLSDFSIVFLYRVSCLFSTISLTIRERSLLVNLLFVYICVLPFQWRFFS